MSKKKISLIQAVLQLMTIVALFIPISFYKYHTELTHLGFKSEHYDLSVYNAMWMSDNSIWGDLLIVFSVLSFLYFVLHLAIKWSKLRKKYCIIIPCIPLLLLTISVFLIDDYEWKSSDFLTTIGFGVDWGFYLVCALYLSMIVLELFKHFSKLEEENKPRAPKTTIVQNTSPADELKKYKDLLDQGIISQEEYDAKKKQLLDL